MCHWGEEPAITGKNGSGTVFFTMCNMLCVYCQNYPISQSRDTICQVAIDVLAMFGSLLEKSVHNINLVSPTPYTLHLIPVLKEFKTSNPLTPVIWNSNAYEKVETLRLLEGLVDIYLPDFRYWDEETAMKYSHIPYYPKTAQKTIIEMHRQTGNLVLNDDGIAIFGTMVRLLVLPDNINRVDMILRWLWETFENDIHISLMGQYFPTYRANDYPEIDRCITQQEYDYLKGVMLALGFENGYTQRAGSSSEWTPDF